VNTVIKNNKLWLSYPTNRAERPENEGAFHETKYSGLKFRVFHVTRGTVFPSVPGYHSPSFPRKYETNEKKTSSRVFFLPYLLALELHDESEVQTNDVFGEDDNNRVRDYFE